MSTQPPGELSAVLGTVVARLAHDVKNPLAVILSNLRFLQMSIEDADDREAIEESLLSATRLDRMLDDAVDIQRLAAEAPLAAATPFALQELEQPLRERVELQAGRRTLELTLPQRKLRVDRALLQRVLINLLEHGFRNTPSGGTVTLRGEPGEAGLTLQVLDQGPGFSPGATPSFLDSELRVKQPPCEGHRSDQGLGLHFAGVAARAMGAQTDVRPRDDGARGLCFELVFARERLG